MWPTSNIKQKTKQNNKHQQTNIFPLLVFEMNVATNLSHIYCIYTVHVHTKMCEWNFQAFAVVIIDALRFTTSL